MPRVWDCDVLKEGDVVGRWRVQAFLGGGGFGAVYAVVETAGRGRRRPARPRLGALKIYRGDPSEDDCHGVDRLVQEGELLKAMKGSPSLPIIYDKGVWKGRPYLVRENLAPVEPDDLPSDDEGLQRFLMDLLDSLDALHRAGWLHCDVKPWNIARRKKDGGYVLIDLGSAHKIEEGEHVVVPGQKTINTVNGKYVRIGTHGYDAPENSFSPSRDIYSVGHVIRDCFRDDVPFEWGVIINRCISNNPDLRYRDVAALRKDVEGINEIRDGVYWRLRMQRIQDQHDTERSLNNARRKVVKWAQILRRDEERSDGSMTTLRISLTQTPRVHYVVREPLVLKPNTILLISGRGILEADISGPASATVVLRIYASFHNVNRKLPPENDLTYVLVGPGSYLNFAKLDARTDYHAFFPNRRRILRDIDATTSFRFSGPKTFSGVETETLEAINASKMPKSYKKVLMSFFRGEAFTVLPVERRKR